MYTKVIYSQHRLLFFFCNLFDNDDFIWFVILALLIIYCCGCNG